MKRLFSITLVGILILTLVITGCGGGNKKADSPRFADCIYVSSVNDANGSIWSINADGTGSRELVANSDDDIYLLQPTLSTDRSRIAYLRYDDDEGTMQVMTIIANNLTPQLVSTPGLINTFTSHGHIALSPDGTKLAYVDSSYHIQVITIGSSSPVQLTDCSSGQDHNPSWSPDGNQISFLHRDTSTYNAKIYKINADGSSVNPYSDELYSMDTLAILNDSLLDPSWSPVNENQMTIRARESVSNLQFYIYTLNLTTKARTRLTTTTDGNTEIFHQWSKDGIYIFTTGSERNIYRTPVNDPSQTTRMTTDGKSSFYGFPPS